MTTRHLSHKTADVIYNHNWEASPTLVLYKGTHPLHEQMASLLAYLTTVAKEKKVRLSVKINRGDVTIRRQ